MKELPENSIYRAQYLQALLNIVLYPSKYNIFSVRPLHHCFNYSSETQSFLKLIDKIHRLEYPMLSLEACTYIFKTTYGDTKYYHLRYRYKSLARER